MGASLRIDSCIRVILFNYELRGMETITNYEDYEARGK
jgi:hypothetical protein